MAENDIAQVNEVICEKCGVALFPTTCFFMGPDGQPECEAGGWHKHKIIIHNPDDVERFTSLISRQPDDIPAYDKCGDPID